MNKFQTIKTRCLKPNIHKTNRNQNGTSFMPNFLKSKAPAIDYSMLILDAIASSQHPLNLSEICLKTKVSVASAHRLINSMLSNNLISLDISRTKSYCIGSKIFQISSAIYNNQRIIPIFHPVAEILKNEIHKNISLSVPIGNRVVVVYQLDFEKIGSEKINIGHASALHCSASGKAILSMLPNDVQEKYLNDERNFPPLLTESRAQIFEDLGNVKRLGYAFSCDDEKTAGSCLSAPVLNLQSQPVAAISAWFQQYDITETEVRKHSKYLIQAARQLSSRII